MLRPEGYSRYLSAWLHFVWLRTENRLPEIDFPFGAERKTKMKEAVINYKTMFYEILEMPFTFSRMSVNMMGTPVSFTQRLYLPS